jgi:transcriptional regulator with XRE-family HTH domain
MTSLPAESVIIPQTRAAVAASVRAHFAVAKTSANKMAGLIGISQPAMSRRTNAELPFDVDQLDAIAAELNITVIELMQMPKDDLRGRAGASGLSAIVYIDEVNEMRSASLHGGIEAVEHDWLAPVTPLTITHEGAAA